MANGGSCGLVEGRCARTTPREEVSSITPWAAWRPACMHEAPTRPLRHGGALQRKRRHPTERRARWWWSVAMWGAVVWCVAAYSGNSAPIHFKSFPKNGESPCGPAWRTRPCAIPRRPRRSSFVQWKCARNSHVERFFPSGHPSMVSLPAPRRVHVANSPFPFPNWPGSHTQSFSFCFVIVVSP